MKRYHSLLLLLPLLLVTACKDEISQTYSTKYRVMCGFTAVAHKELYTAVNAFGQFCTIRQSGDRIIMFMPGLSRTEYNLDALSKDFRFGLGGLIVGSTQYGDLRAYDLACPNCDRVERRLDFAPDDNGAVVCSKCGIRYSLNYDGQILDRGNGMHSKPRSLYRYHIEPNREFVRIHN